MNQCSTEWTVGMDLGDRNHATCILDASGEVSETAGICNRRDGLDRFFGRFSDPGAVTVAMEAGTHSRWISHHLSELGFKVMVGNARKLRVIWQSDHKDDNRDAEMLARIGRFDPKLLYPIRHRSMSAHADLAVIRARDALVRARSSLINCARGLVKSFGHRLPTCSAPAFPMRVSEHVPVELMPAVGPLLSQISALNTQIRECERCIERLCEHVYPETRRVRQIAGVGPITALAFILTLEDPERFQANRSVGPFLGLTPKRDQSGNTDKQLPISKAGDGYLRRLLVQSAHYVLGPFGPDCDLRRFGERIVAKGGRAPRQRAATAVARKLSVLMLRLWKTGEEYEPFHRQSSRNNRRTAETAA